MELIGGVGVSESARFIGDEVVFKTIENLRGGVVVPPKRRTVRRSVEC